MSRLVIYIHGKGGNANEAEHYKSLFPENDVIGFDYRSQNPWDAKITIMPDGEHWFHTEKQKKFLNQWINVCNLRF